MLSTETSSTSNKLYPEKLFRNSQGHPNTKVDYIVSENHMRGLVFGLSDKLKHPIVVLQRNLKTEGCEKCLERNCKKKAGFCNYGNYSRMESTLFYSHWATYCAKIRDTISNAGCCSQDERIADYLLSSQNPKQKRVTIDVRDNLQTTLKKVREQEGHILFRYECPVSHYDEIAFKINVNGIEGVIIIGQYLFDDMSEKRKRILRSTAKTFLKDDEYQRLEQSLGNPVSVDEIDKIFKEVIAFENDLRTAYYSRINTNLLEIQQSVISVFNKEMLNYSEKTPTPLFSNPIDQCNEKYTHIKTALGKALSVFITSIEIDEKNTDVFFSMPKDLIFESEYAIYKCVEGLWNVEYKSKSFSNFIELARGQIGNKKAGSIDLKNGYYLYYTPLNLTERRYIYIISQSNLCDSNIIKLIESFMSYVCFATAELFAQFNEVQIATYTKIMRHELGQLNSAIQIRIQQFEYAIKKYSHEFKNTFFMDDCMHVVDDYKSFAHAATLRCNSSRYFTMLPAPYFKWFYPYEEFLYKWKYIYAEAAKNKQITFDMQSTTLADITRPMMYADAPMIEQVAYNLTNNALKYSLKGSKISFDCRLSEDKKEYQIIVTNYAHSISEEDTNHIFEYGYRGSNQTETEGSGLGLYLSERIANLHGGTLRLKAEKISDFDVSCLLVYDDMPEKYKDSVLDKKIQNELELLKGTSGFSDFKKPNSINSVFTPLYFLAKLDQGTTKYTFVFSIPYDKKRGGQQ